MIVPLYFVQRNITRVFKFLNRNHSSDCLGSMLQLSRVVLTSETATMQHCGHQTAQDRNKTPETQTNPPVEPPPRPPQPTEPRNASRPSDSGEPATRTAFGPVQRSRLALVLGRQRRPANTFGGERRSMV